MKHKYNVDTLIIGSGFSGRTVAHQLEEGSYLIVERGEYRSHTDFYKNYIKNKDKYEYYWQTARHSYKSDIPFNETYNLTGSLKSFSQFEFIGGGSSNRWDGNAVRVSKEVIEAKDDNYLNWSIDYKTMDEEYKYVEKLLNLCGDYHSMNPGQPPVKINSGDKVRENFKKVNFNILLRNQAKNPIRPHGKKALCIGAGACEICPVDAKARPENIFEPHNIKYGILVKKVHLTDDKATHVSCVNKDGEEFTIGFTKLVVAAHAIESAKLVHNSFKDIKSENKPKYVGNFFQDHAQANIFLKAPFKVTEYPMPFKGSFQIQELTKMFNGIDIKVSFSRRTSKFTKNEWTEWILNKQKDIRSFSDIEKYYDNMLEVALTYEMPPIKDCKINFEKGHPVVDFDAYQDLVKTYETVYSKTVLPELQKRGFELLAFRPHYRHIVGQHHLAGTLNLSDGEYSVLDESFRIKGYKNFYIAGTAAIPRLGSSNPTLTGMALSNMVGKIIKNKDT